MTTAPAAARRSSHWQLRLLGALEARSGDVHVTRFPSQPTALLLANPPGSGLPDELDRSALQRRCVQAHAVAVGHQHVLDNFEQVRGGAALLQALHAGALGLSLLVTSRCAAGVEGECEVAWAPLPLPALDASLDAVARNASVALFVQCARSVRPDFQATRATAWRWPRCAAPLKGCRWPSSWPRRARVRFRWSRCTRRCKTRWLC